MGNDGSAGFPRATGCALLARAYGGLFLATVAGTAAFQRELARFHLSIAGIPVFACEALTVVLLLLLALVALENRQRPFPRELFPWLVVAFLAIGAVATMRGLDLGFGLAALRDAALAYYALYALLALAFTRFGGGQAALAAALAGGAMLGGVVWTLRFLLHPSLIDGHGVPSFAGILAWLGIVGALFAPPSPAWRRAVRLAGLAACTFVVVLSAYRTMVGVLVATAAVLALAGTRQRDALGFQPLRRLGAWAAVTVTTVALLRWLFPLPPSPLVIDGAQPLPQALAVVAHRWWPAGIPRKAQLSSGSTVSGEAAPTLLSAPGKLGNSMTFRTQAWRNAVTRIRRHPLTGIGFGPPAALFPDFQCQLATSPLSNCGNAHNTYLTVAMRFGLPVFALFVLTNLVAVVRGATAIAARFSPQELSSLACLAAAYVSLAVYGAMSLLLESPYLALLFWTLLGGLAASRTASRPPGEGATLPTFPGTREAP